VGRLVTPVRLSAGALLAAAWLAAVAAIALLQDGGSAVPSALAASPQRLWNGEVWTLASSALVIDGPPVAQFALLLAVTAWFIARVGAGAFWLVALAGHIGATLLSYIGIGLLWLVSRPTVEPVIEAPDFGISAILAAALGGLSVVGWHIGGRRRRRIVAAWAGAVLLAFVVSVPLDGELADVEHLLAYLSGVVAAMLLQPRLHVRLRNAG
jgi:hypothetical protein